MGRYHQTGAQLIRPEHLATEQARSNAAWDLWATEYRAGDLTPEQVNDLCQQACRATEALKLAAKRAEGIPLTTTEKQYEAWLEGRASHPYLPEGAPQQ